MSEISSLIDILYENGLEFILSILILGTIRTLGLLYGFTMFAMAIGPTRLIRIPLALGISIPLWVANAQPIKNLVADSDAISVALIGGKEFLIGYIIGFIAFIPFFSVKFAAAAVDHLKGEGNPSFKMGMSENISSTQILYTVIAFLAFLFTDGFIVIFNVLYRSYDIWTINEFLPGLSDMAGKESLDLLSSILFITVQLSIPVIGFLVVIEISCGIAGRISSKISLYNFSFIFKNIIFLLCIPIIVIFLTYRTEDVLLGSDDIIHRIRRFFDE